MAYLGVDALLGLGVDQLPRAEQIGIDGRVLAFTAAVSLATGGLFGLAPALRATATALSGALRGGWAQSDARSSGRLRSAFVIAEVALAVMLVTGAGLLVRSFAELRSIDAGFRAERLLVFDLAPPASRYDEAARVHALYADLVARAEALPGVAAAATVLTAPVAGGGYSTSLRIEGRPRPESEEPSVAWNAASPGYFRTIGAPLIAGREFTDADGSDAPQVAIVNRSAADRFWPGEDPIGRRISTGPSPDAPWATIVGVVADIREDDLDAAPRPTVYMPFAQNSFRSRTVVVRTRSEPAALAPALRSIIRDVDADTPILDLRTGTESLAFAVAEPRFNTVLLGALAGIALLLACVGIYGVLAYAVGQRARELGLRMAVGASRATVTGLVVRDGLRLTAIGIGVGLAGALALTRLLAGLLYAVGATDPATFAAVAGLVAATALAATWLPARRASRVDPMVALRAD